MFIEFSVIFAFASLFIASVFDVRSEKGDVPEIILFSGLAAGVILHVAESISTWSIIPLYWSLGVGIAFTAYGYFAYVKGMWGGADMLGLSIVGFSTPYFLGLMGVLDLLVNIMATGFVYALGFGAVKGLFSAKTRSGFYNYIREYNALISASIGVIAVFSYFLHLENGGGVLFFSLFVSMIFIYFFMKSVEDVAMTITVDASEVEVGDVLAEGEIKGVTEEELEELTGDVELKEGIRFMPVFPVALLLTVSSISVFQFLVQLF